MAQAIITESYTLPSLGKVYDTEVNPHITLRAMTTAEEMKRLSPSDRSFKNLAEIMNDCLVDKPGIDAYDLCTGDFQFLLHKMRIVTYGTSYNMINTCPYCGYNYKSVINLEDFPILEYSEDLNKFFEIDLPKSNRHVKLRMQTPRMLDDVAIKAKELRKKAPNFPGDPAFLFTLTSMISEIDGKKPDPIKLEDFIKSAHMADTNILLETAEILAGKIGIDTTINTTCNVCGEDFMSSFRFTQEFFRPTNY